MSEEKKDPGSREWLEAFREDQARLGRETVERGDSPIPTGCVVLPGGGLEMLVCPVANAREQRFAQAHIKQRCLEAGAVGLVVVVDTWRATAEPATPEHEQLSRVRDLRQHKGRTEALAAILCAPAFASVKEWPYRRTPQGISWSDPETHPGGPVTDLWDPWLTTRPPVRPGDLTDEDLARYLESYAHPPEGIDEWLTMLPDAQERFLAGCWLKDRLLELGADDERADRICFAHGQRQAHLPVGADPWPLVREIVADYAVGRWDEPGAELCERLIKKHGVPETIRWAMAHRPDLMRQALREAIANPGMPKTPWEEREGQG